MTIIPKIQCPYCHTTTNLAKFMSKSNILDGKNIGYCPNCKKLCHITVSCTISASTSSSEDYLKSLKSSLRAWETLKPKSKTDTNLRANQIKNYKDCIKKWSQLEKEK